MKTLLVIVTTPPICSKLVHLPGFYVGTRSDAETKDCNHSLQRTGDVCVCVCACVRAWPNVTFTRFLAASQFHGEAALLVAVKNHNVTFMKLRCCRFITAQGSAL